MTEPTQPNLPQNTDTSSPAPGTPEYDAAQAAKFDAANAGDLPTKAERPEHIPEKFWDADKGEVRVEALAKSYAELEKSRATKQNDTPENSQAGADKAAAALHEVGLDYNRYVDEFMANGSLSDATYAEMAAKNIPRSVVDTHIDVQVQLAQKEADALRQDVLSVVGGEDKYQDMARWMVANMPHSEIKSYNAVMDSGDIGQIKLAVQGVFAKFQDSRGSEPTLLQGGKGDAAGDVYRSTAQLTEAMKDPRYAKDPAYRQEVADRLARSNIM